MSFLRLQAKYLKSWILSLILLARIGNIRIILGAGDSDVARHNIIIIIIIIGVPIYLLASSTAFLEPDVSPMLGVLHFKLRKL